MSKTYYFIFHNLPLSLLSPACCINSDCERSAQREILLRTKQTMKPFNVSGQLEKNIKATSLYLVALEGKMSLLTHNHWMWFLFVVIQCVEECVLLFKKPAVNGLGQISLLGEPDQPRPLLGLNLVPTQAKPVLASPVQTFPPAQLAVCSVSHPEIHQKFKK